MPQELSQAVVSAEVLSKKDLALEKAGATRELAYRTLVEACSATVVKYDRDGDCIGEQPDYPTRVKAAESISRLNGDLKELPLVDARVYNIQNNITSDELKAFTSIVESMKEEIRNLRSNGRQTGEIIDVESVRR